MGFLQGQPQNLKKVTTTGCPSAQGNFSLPPLGAFVPIVGLVPIGIGAGIGVVQVAQDAGSEALAKGLVVRKAGMAIAFSSASVLGAFGSLDTDDVVKVGILTDDRPAL
jgi:hypothetical protein